MGGGQWTLSSVSFDPFDKLEVGLPQGRADLPDPAKLNRKSLLRSVARIPRVLRGLVRGVRVWRAGLLGGGV